MRVFHCDGCGQTVFFENSVCVACERTLAYLPELGAMAALEPLDDGTWRSLAPASDGAEVRLCENGITHAICNWAVAMEDADSLCRSCRLTQMLPALDVGGNLEAWRKLEAAKRRLVYTLLDLGLPLDGLRYRFLSDDGDDVQGSVLTGHEDGIITINIAEADDLERERRRLNLHEPYRTLLGHFRHEVGHYYWDRLIRDGDRLQAFRECFGDERQDYASALQRHYERGPAPQWQVSHVSAYASAHPWEDWAETWAHYLHMLDSLETAVRCGVRIRPQRDDEPSLTSWDGTPLEQRPFDMLIREWLALTYVLNNLNRSLGLADGYPFVLAEPVIRKLRFVHENLRPAAPPSTVANGVAP